MRCALLYAVFAVWSRELRELHTAQEYSSSTPDRKQHRCLRVLESSLTQPVDIPTSIQSLGGPTRLSPFRLVGQQQQQQQEGMVVIVGACYDVNGCVQTHSAGGLDGWPYF